MKNNVEEKGGFAEESGSVGNVVEYVEREFLFSWWKKGDKN